MIIVNAISGSPFEYHTNLIRGDASLPTTHKYTYYPIRFINFGRTWKHTD